MAHTSQFCTFYLDKLLFGVELKGVQEVIRSLEMTKVPLAPAVVSGLINLRGSVRSMIGGVHKLNHRLLHVLDIEKGQMTESRPARQWRLCHRRAMHGRRQRGWMTMGSFVSYLES
jgi:hypothetical protein